MHLVDIEFNHLVVVRPGWHPERIKSTKNQEIFLICKFFLGIVFKMRKISMEIQGTPNKKRASQGV